MEKTNVRRTGRKPKSDPADYRYSFRLNAGENSRFEQMLAESGAKDRTLFIKKAIFGGTLKVVKTDKATMDYYIAHRKSICFIKMKKQCQKRTLSIQIIKHSCKSTQYYIYIG